MSVMITNLTIEQNQLLFNAFGRVVRGDGVSAHTKEAAEWLIRNRHAEDRAKDSVVKDGSFVRANPGTAFSPWQVKELKELALRINLS